jgi:hypothetical protein
MQRMRPMHGDRRPCLSNMRPERHTEIQISESAGTEALPPQQTAVRPISFNFFAILGLHSTGFFSVRKVSPAAAVISVSNVDTGLFQISVRGPTLAPYRSAKTENSHV